MSDDLIVSGIRFDTSGDKTDLADIAKSAEAMGASVKASADATAKSVASVSQAAQMVAKDSELMASAIKSGLGTASAAFGEFSTEEVRALSGGMSEFTRQFISNMQTGAEQGADAFSRALKNGLGAANAVFADLSNEEIRKLSAAGATAGSSYSEEFTSHINLAGVEAKYDAMFLAPAQLAAKAKQSAEEFVKSQEAVYQARMAEIKLMQLNGLMSPAEAAKAGTQAAVAYNDAIRRQTMAMFPPGGGGGGGGPPIAPPGGPPNGPSGPNDPNQLIVYSNAIKQVGQASVLAGAGLGRLRFGLVSFIASATGTIPVLDRLLSIFLFMGMESAIVLGVLAAIAAIIALYRKLTEASREAAAEQERQTKALDAWYKKQQEGASGDFVSQIEAQRKKLSDMTETVNGLGTAFQNAHALGADFLIGFLALIGQINQVGNNVHVPFGVQLKAQFAELMKGIAETATLGAITGRGAKGVLEEWYKQQTEEVRKGSDELAAAIAESTNREIDAYTERQSKMASSLSSLLGSGRSTPAFRQLAEQLRSQLTQDVSIDTQATKTSDPEARAKAIERLVKSLGSLKEVSGALDSNPYDKLTEAIDSLTRQVHPTNSALASFDERVKSTQKSLKELPGAVAAFSAAAAKLRVELIEIERTKALDSIAKEAASITVTKVDDLTQGLIEYERNAKNTRSSLEKLGDPSLLALFDKQHAASVANKIALIELSAATESAAEIEKHLGNEQEAVADVMGRWTAKAQESARILTDIIKHTIDGSEANKAARVALDELNASMDKANTARADYSKTIEKQVEAIGKLNTEQAKEQNTRAAEKILEKEGEATKTLIKDMQHDMSQFFSNIFTEGVKSFGDLFTQIKNMFLRLIADMLAAQAMKKMTGVVMGLMGNLSPNIMMDQNGQMIASKAGIGSASGSLLKGIGAAGLGGMVGYELGSQNPGSASGAALTGVLGGAAVGAAVGGPWGAAIGATAGLIGGLLGHAKAAKEAKEAEEALRKQYEKDIQSYKVSVGVLGSVSDALASNDAKFQTVRDEIEKAYAGKKNQAEREAKLSELDGLKVKGAAKVASDFWDGITSQLNSLNGPAGEYTNSLAEIEKQYEDNKKSAISLHATNEQLAQIEDLRTKKEAQLKEQFEEAQRQQQGAFNIRGAAAGGASDKVLSDMQFALAQEKELSDLRVQGADPKIIEQVQNLQAAEKQKRDEDYAEAQKRAQSDYQVRALAAQGHSAEAAALQFAEQQRREFDDAVKAGMDDATKAALQLAQAAEKASFDAAQARAAMDSAFSDLQQQFQVFGTNPQDQLSQISDLFGFSGLSKDQVLAQYVKYTGTPLTDDQRDLNKHIEEWLQAFGNAQGGSTPNASMKPVGDAQAVVNAASVLTEVTGNRMADYLNSILIVERQSFTELQKHTMLLGGGTLGGLPTSLSAVPLTTPTRTASPTTSPSELDKLINSISALSAGDTFNITVKVDRSSGLDDSTYIQLIATEVVDRVNVLMADRTRSQQLRAGTTVKDV